MSVKYLSATVVDTKNAGGNGGWTAVASTPTIDHDGESLARGCFLPLPASIKVHVDHDLRIASLVGKARPFYDGDRLMIDGEFASTPLAQEIRGLVGEGIVDAMSVVFVDAVRKHIDGVPTVTKGTLKACDFVTLGANPEARLVSVRSLRLGDPAGAAHLAAFKAQLALLQADLAALGGPPPVTKASVDTALRDARRLLDDLGRER